MSSRFAILREALPTDSEPIRWFRAPGRVNLIGDHTDYNDGFALPLAIDRDCLVACRPRSDGRVRVRSLELDGSVDVAADGTDEPATFTPAWGRYVGGVVRSLAELGSAPIGLDAVVSSTVPPGSGLSSSAAIEVALALALTEAGNRALDPVGLAQACQHAEHLATGVPSGVMDQLASVFGQPGHGLLIDCRELTVVSVALPPSCAVLVVHSGISRTLETSDYAQRRAACEAAARRLGVPALRDASPADVVDDPRARHVVSENQRVHAFVDALRAGAVDELGPLLLSSHASLRDDYDVSTPELDLLVELLVEHGALGARLTGAGFGGCVVALTRTDDAPDVATKTAARYRSATGLEPSAFVVQATGGAAELAPGTIE